MAEDIVTLFGTGEEYLINVKEGGLSMEEPVTAYPFQAITEIYEAGKSYGEKALEEVKKVISYPYEKVVEALTKEEPTGIIQSENTFSNFLQKAIKPPYIFILLGIAGFWLYFGFKKR